MSKCTISIALGYTEAFPNLKIFIHNLNYLIFYLFKSWVTGHRACTVTLVLEKMRSQPSCRVISQVSNATVRTDDMPTAIFFFFNEMQSTYTTDVINLFDLRLIYALTGLTS